MGSTFVQLHLTLVTLICYRQSHSDLALYLVKITQITQIQHYISLRGRVRPNVSIRYN